MGATRPAAVPPKPMVTTVSVAEGRSKRPLPLPLPSSA